MTFFFLIGWFLGSLVAYFLVLRPQDRRHGGGDSPQGSWINKLPGRRGRGGYLLTGGGVYHVKKVIRLEIRRPLVGLGV